MLTKQERQEIADRANHTRKEEKSLAGTNSHTFF